MPDTAPIGADGFPRSEWTPPDTGIQLAPGGLAAAQAAGYAPAATPAPAAMPLAASTFQATPATEPKHVPVVVDLSGKPMSKVYDLDWPKSVDGVEIRQVVAHRVSTAEVSAFIDRVRDAADGESLPYPIFRRVDGAPLTAAEWAALDDDDTYRMVREANGFLPARWAAVLGIQTSASPPPAPAITGSSSPASPASPSAS